MGDKSVFPLFYFGTKSIIILQRNCKLIKRIKYLLSLNTGITLFLYIHEKNKSILTTRQVKITVSCDIHARQSYFVFLFYMVQCRNKIAKRRKILMMMKHWFSWFQACEKKRPWILCFIFFCDFCKLFRFKRNKLKVKAILFSSRQFIQWRIWVYNSLFRKFCNCPVTLKGKTSLNK